MIEGNPLELFTRFPQYFYNVELKDPNTVTDTTTNVTRHFATYFFALGCALMRKMLIIDGVHLKGDYLGTMFLAVVMDTNNQVVPIAIEVAKSEGGESCSYVFQMLRMCIGEMEGRGGFKCEPLFGCEREDNQERDMWRMTRRHSSGFASSYKGLWKGAVAGQPFGSAIGMPPDCCRNAEGRSLKRFIED
ncbi:hypothetical protein OSB04_017002 [Centaurea solstitialis]|uniref:MULE transposase domain-containing protein n=1 Tax=Centaurea solstitialis TaxID=347529 RepID=A0AA38TK82_9ASTR|nr:hypothetical protein OSB04_017002 [Centaurea solstitialis]